MCMTRGMGRLGRPHNRVIGRRAIAWVQERAAGSGGAAALLGNQVGDSATNAGRRRRTRAGYTTGRRPPVTPWALGHAAFAVSDSGLGVL